MSFTPALPKVAEEFVVSKYIGPAILCQIDPNQFGVMLKSSTSMTAISVIHQLSQSTVRIVLFDDKKAVDLIDHCMLAEKISRLPVPKAVARWTIDFLLQRKQKVKFSNDCVLEWGEVRADVPKITEVSTWKYIDGTTVPKVAKKGDTSKAQDKVTTLENWSNSNRLLLNADKCKELQIYETKLRSSDS